MRKLLLFGYIAPASIIISTLVIGALHPDYSHARQWISELAADGVPYSFWMNVFGIILFGVSIFMFSIFLLIYLRETRTLTFAFILLAFSGILFMTAGLFNCDSGCPFINLSAEATVHNYAAFLAFITGILCQIIVGLHYFRKGFRNGYFLFSILIAAGSLLAFYLLGYHGIESPNRGIYQRLLIVAYCFWLFKTASYMQVEYRSK